MHTFIPKHYGNYKWIGNDQSQSRIFSTTVSPRQPPIRTHMFHGDEAVGALALDGVWMGDDSRLRYRRVLHQRRLNLRRGQQVPWHVHHVVNTPRHPDVPVSVNVATWSQIRQNNNDFNNNKKIQ